MKKMNRIQSKTGDLSILLLVAILVTFGIVMIFSASYYSSISTWGDPYHYLKRQIIWVTVGSVGMWVTSKIDYHLWARLWVIVPFICLILLLLVFTPLASSAKGATRWIEDASSYDHARRTCQDRYYFVYYWILLKASEMDYQFPERRTTGSCSCRYLRRY